MIFGRLGLFHVLDVICIRIDRFGGLAGGRVKKKWKIQYYSNVYKLQVSTRTGLEAILKSKTAHFGHFWPVSALRTVNCVTICNICLLRLSFKEVLKLVCVAEHPDPLPLPCDCGTTLTYHKLCAKFPYMASHERIKTFREYILGQSSLDPSLSYLIVTFK